MGFYSSPKYLHKLSSVTSCSFCTYWVNMRATLSQGLIVAKTEVLQQFIPSYSGFSRLETLYCRVGIRWGKIADGSPPSPRCPRSRFIGRVNSSRGKVGLRKVAGADTRQLTVGLATRSKAFAKRGVHSHRCQVSDPCLCQSHSYTDA